MLTLHPSLAANPRNAPRTAGWALALRAGAALGLGTLGLLLGVGGCDSRSPTAKAVEHASRELSVLATSGSPSPSQELETQQYKKVTEGLKGVLDQGLPQEQAAALVLTAQAKLSMAEHAANDFATQERESLDRATVIRGLLAEWLSHTGQASATEGYDPTTVIADLGKRSGERGKDAEQAKQVKAELDGKIAALRSDIKGKVDAAAAAENTYAGLKTRATAVSATQAEGIIKQASESKRSADSLRHDAALLSARADQLDPQAHEAQLQVDQFLNQRKSLETMASQLQTRFGEAKKEAAGSRSDAAKVAERLEKNLVDLREQRSGVLSQAFDSTISQLSDAANTARKATGDDNGASKLTVGAAKQSAGDLHWARAHGLRAYANLLKSLAASTPGLPNREKYLSESGEVLKAMKESGEAAKAAYEEAKSAYSSAKATGEAREKLQNLSTLLEKIPDLIDGKIPDLAAAMAAVKKSEGGEDSAPAAVAVAGTPKAESGDLNGAIDGVLAAMSEQRYSDLRGMMVVAPGYEAISEAMLQSAGSFAKLDAACKAKFNVGAREALKGLPGAGGGANQMQLGGDEFLGKKAADLEVNAEGDNATAGLAGSQNVLHFAKQEGAWKLDLQFDKLVPVASIPQMMALFGPIGQGMEDLAADVEAGKFKTIQAVGVGLMQKIQAAMGAAGAGNQGGGG